MANAGVFSPARRRRAKLRRDILGSCVLFDCTRMAVSHSTEGAAGLSSNPSPDSRRAGTADGRRACYGASTWMLGPPQQRL